MIDAWLLTVREAAAVAAVTAHYAEHGRPPSYKEIGARLGVRTSQADRLVKAAARLGSLVVVRVTGIRTQIRLCPALERQLAPPPVVVASAILPRPGNDRETNPARLAA